MIQNVLKNRQKQQQQQQHMKIARQSGKTAFVTLAQIWTNCIHIFFLFTVYSLALKHSSIDVVEKFIEKANKHHPTIKFTAEILCTDAPP